MNKKYYQFGNHFKIKFREHFCYKCGTKLFTFAHCKVVSHKAEEAKCYDFSAGVDVGVMVGPCEFVHDVFFCSKCSKQIEFVTQLSFEDVDIYIKKLKKKYFKKGIDLEIKKSYELKDGQQVDEFGQIEDIQHVCLSGCKDGEKLFVCKIPMLRKNRWERPYYFKISAKKFIK